MDKKTPDNQFFTTREEIADWFKQNIEDAGRLSNFNYFSLNEQSYNFIINNDLTVNIAGSIDLSGMDLEYIPVQFNRITGSFNCSENRLTSLKGSPSFVGEDFCCSYNELKNLEYSPLSVHRNFKCNFNKLKSLKGCPSFVGGSLLCVGNKLTTYDGVPKYLSGRLFDELIFDEHSSPYKLIQSETAKSLYNNGLLLKDVLAELLSKNNAEMVDEQVDNSFKN